MLKSKIWIQLALEYLAESAREFRYGLLRDAIERRIEMPESAVEQILSVLPPAAATDGVAAVDVGAFSAEILELAAAFATVHELSPMLIPHPEVSDEARLDAQRATATIAIVQRCADYAARAAAAPSEQHLPALQRLAAELRALSKPLPASSPRSTERSSSGKLGF